jgi:FdhD protein
MSSPEMTENGSRAASTTSLNIKEVRDGAVASRADQVATEEPMEIRVLASGRRVTAAVTMRTPGSDFELAAGFLYGEGLLGMDSDISGISYCVDKGLDETQLFNIVNVKLRPGLVPDLRSLERHFYTSSSCGVCGKASLESLDLRGCRPPAPGPQVTTEVVASLPAALRRAQGLFESTGGLHAAGLFTSDGELVAVREDVGRHNAVDKLIGWALLQGNLPLAGKLLMVSGRSSFEIMQKALTAGIPMVCAVSAPSSLAVDVARRFDMSLVGFLRGPRFNIYAGEQRILTSP